MPQDLDISSINYFLTFWDWAAREINQGEKTISFFLSCSTCSKGPDPNLWSEPRQSRKLTAFCSFSTTTIWKSEHYSHKTRHQSVYPSSSFLPPFVNKTPELLLSWEQLASDREKQALKTWWNQISLLF